MVTVTVLFSSESSSVSPANGSTFFPSGPPAFLEERCLKYRRLSCQVPDAVRRFTPESVELEATATFAFQSPSRGHKRSEASPVRPGPGAPGFSPLKPSPSLSAKSAKSQSSARSRRSLREDLRSTSPFRLSVFSSTERSLPGAL